MRILKLNQLIKFTSLLTSFESKAICLIFSVKTLRVSLQNLCYVFNISLFFFANSFLPSLRLSALISFFSKWFISFSI